MTTDLSSASIPQLYREVFDVCSNDGAPISQDIYRSLLQQCKLSEVQIKNVRDIAGISNEAVNRTDLYKTLALVAWCQQGKQLTDKLFLNCVEREYPCPEINDLSVVTNLKIKLNVKRSTENGINFSVIRSLDIINIHLVPEKKGLFLKYSEYVITSKRFNSKVTRRYNDFVALKELLLNRFPYRLIPSLPPKKIASDAHFLESRRRALHRWLTLISRHPVISRDPILQFFLSDQGPDCQHRIREIYKRVPDEFMTSDIAGTAKDLLPSDHGHLAANSQNIRVLVNVIGKVKQLVEQSIEHQTSAGRDFEEFSSQLKLLSTLNISESRNSVSNWTNVQKGFTIVSSELNILSSKSKHNALNEQDSVCERLGLLLDILVAHKDLCERLERGLHNDHAEALSKLLSMKKRKIQGVIRGSDSESVEHLESKMLTHENVISNMELRADFSLYCVHMETQLVYAYLGTLSGILKSLVDLKRDNHFEIHKTWQQISESVRQFFPHNDSIDNEFNAGYQ